MDNNINIAYMESKINKIIKRILEHNRNKTVKIRDIDNNVCEVKLSNDIVKYRVIQAIISKGVDNIRNIDSLLLNEDIYIVEAHNKIYFTIPKDIAKYLIYKKQPKVIYDWYEYNKIYFHTGPSVQLFTQLFKKAKNIENKKWLLLDNSSIVRDDFAYFALQSQYKITLEQMIQYFTMNNDKFKPTILDTCYTNNISSGDLIYRLMCGMDMQEAIDIGKQEQQKYKLQYMGSISPLALHSGTSKRRATEFLIELTRDIMKNDTKYQQVIKNKETN